MTMRMISLIRILLVAAAAAAVKNPTRNPGAAVVEAFAVGAGIIRRTGAPTSRRIAPHYLIQHRRVVVVVDDDVVLKKTTNTALAVKESSRINVDDMQTTTTTDSSPETTQPPSFDPLGLSSSSSSSLKNGETIITSGEAWSSSSSSSSLEHQKVDGTEKDGVVKKQEMGLWAARGILLLVAAIWGTNFAVRTFFFCVRACLIRFCVHT
jgi:hypothetical protein